jgi:hypothetical protein
MTVGNTPIPSRGACQVATAVTSVTNESCCELFPKANIKTSFNRRNSCTTVRIRITICSCRAYPCFSQTFAAVNLSVIRVASTDLAFLDNDLSHSSSESSKSLMPGSMSMRSSSVSQGKPLDAKASIISLTSCNSELNSI